MPRARMIGKDGKLYELRKTSYKCGLCKDILESVIYNECLTCSCDNLYIAGGVDTARTLNFKIESYQNLSEWKLVEDDVN
jgi:hypothetical protein